MPCEASFGSKSACCQDNAVESGFFEQKQTQGARAVDASVPCEWALEGTRLNEWWPERGSR